MSFLIVLAGFALLIFLIYKKLNPMIALLIVAILLGLLLQMPFAKVIKAVNNGIGNTLAGLVMVLALGAMMGKLAEDSGAAKKIVAVLTGLFGVKNIQWAVLLTGILVGIPLFYNAGFVVLIPLIFSISAATNLPKLYIGLPMAAALSITHGFLPPHPGPVALSVIFKADIGLTLIYGLVLCVPIAIFAGILLPRLIIKLPLNVKSVNIKATEEELPGAATSFTIALLPVVLIALGTIGTSFFKTGYIHSLALFFQEPFIALLISLLLTLVLLKIPLHSAMNSCVEGIKSIAMIMLIIAAGGAFKQVLIDSGVGEQVKNLVSDWQISPLILGWLIAAVLRITLGSATVAALTASGIVFPLIVSGVSPELMVLSVGAGSLMLSHVNDTGFWMFKEYFNLSLKETFKTWTLMESCISVLGLLGVLIISWLGG